MLTMSCTDTSIFHTPTLKETSFGPPVRMRVCILRNEKASDRQIDVILGRASDELRKYGIQIVKGWVRTWHRPGATLRSVVDDLGTEEIEAACDRLVAIVDLTVTDLLWLHVPNIVSASENVTHTRGYIIGKQPSLDLLSEKSLADPLIVFYNFLGCDELSDMNKCYPKIAALKVHVEPANDFLTAVDSQGRFIVTREAANQVMRDVLRHNAEIGGSGKLGAVGRTVDPTK